MAKGRDIVMSSSRFLMKMRVCGSDVVEETLILSGVIVNSPKKHCKVSSAFSVGSLRS